MSSKTICLSLSDRVLEELNRLAKRERRTRSSVLRDAILEYMRRRVGWEELQGDAAERARRRGISSEDDVERLVDEIRECVGREYRA